MSNRNTIFCLLAGIVLAVAAHIYISYGGGGKLAPRTAVLNRAMLQADRIAVERPGRDAVELRRTDSGWRMVEPYAAEAAQAGVSRMLDSLVLLKIVETYSDKYLLKAGRRRSDFGLANPSVKITVSKGSESVRVVLGDMVPGGEGVFAAVEGDGTMYVLDRRVLEFSDVGPDGFRSREIVKRRTGEIEMFSIKCAGGAMMNFVRSDGRWMCRADRNASADTPASGVKIEEFLSALVKSEARSFVWPVGASNEPQVATAPLLAGYGLDSENGIALTIHDRGLNPVRMVLGNEAEGGLVYALVQDSSAVVTVDGRLKDLAVKSDFSDLRVFPFDAAGVVRLSVTDDDVEYLLAKKPDGEWIIDSPVSAQADGKEVQKLIERILAATVDDRDANGITVSVSTNAPAERLSPSVLPEDFSFARLRSREISAFDPSDIRRIVSCTDDSPDGSSVVFDKDKRAWIVENSESGTSVRQKAVADILGALESLEAVSIVSLKATESELKEFGLDKPRYTVSVDFFKENSLRRNIFVGERTEAGYYATMGAAFDAVFILSHENVARITAPLVAK